MADWANHAITGLLSASFVAALFAGWRKLSDSRHRQRRQDRIDEIDVLHGTITELRVDRDKDHEELARYEKQLSDLRSEHTACLLNMERQKQELRWCKQQNIALTERVERLEAAARDRGPGGSTQQLQQQEQQQQGAEGEV